MPDVAASGWKRLGDLIEKEVPRRRMTWAAFVAYSGLGKRTVYDLRAGIRTAYDPGTLARLESALWWEYGSVDKVLKGQEPDRIQDPYMARLRHAWPTLTPEVRALLADLAERSAER